MSWAWGEDLLGQAAAIEVDAQGAIEALVEFDADASVGCPLSVRREPSLRGGQTASYPGMLGSC